MKRFTLILSFFVAMLFGAIFIVALPNAEKEVQQSLKNIGFKQAQLPQARFTLSGLIFDTINLDGDDFNQLKGVSIDLFWPSYLIRKHIKNITVNHAQFSIVYSDIQKITRILKKNIFSTNLFADNLILKDIIIDTGTQRKALQFNGDLKILTHQNHKKIITATLIGNQYDVAFNSDWSGVIDGKENIFELNGDIQNIKINSDIFSLKRGNGWLSLKRQNKLFDISGQIEAGSGHVFKAPMNNISFMLGKNNDNYPVLFRADASGLENAHITADYTFNTNVTKRDFSAKLTVQQPKELITYLKHNKVIAENISSSAPDTPLRMSIEYMEDKRFSNGPLPFDVQSSNSKSEQINGTFLIYPDNYDIRGTINLSDDILKFTKAIFNVSDEHSIENTLRLNSNLKSLLH